jgi:hypothetical protein
VKFQLAEVFVCNLRGKRLRWRAVFGLFQAV